MNSWYDLDSRFFEVMPAVTSVAPLLRDRKQISFLANLIYFHTTAIKDFRHLLVLGQYYHEEAPEGCSDAFETVTLKEEHERADEYLAEAQRLNKVFRPMPKYGTLLFTEDSRQDKILYRPKQQHLEQLLTELEKHAEKTAWQTVGSGQYIPVSESSFEQKNVSTPCYAPGAIKDAVASIGCSPSAVPKTIGDVPLIPFLPDGDLLKNTVDAEQRPMDILQSNGNGVRKRFLT